MNDAPKDFRKEIQHAFETAFRSGKGGDPAWNTFLGTYSILPLSDKDKEAISNSGMKISTGAYPIELRRVYQAIVLKHGALAQQTQNQPLHDLLQGFNIDAEVMGYYNKIKPFAGLNDIFKNAAAGSKKYSQGMVDAKTSTHRCKSCGAPRLEEMQYEECLFCGGELFEKTPEENT